jgi:hypothetical protein
MKLLQWNLRMSLRFIAWFTLFGMILGLIYETRFGYELMTPDPLPAPAVAPVAREGIVPKVCVGFKPGAISLPWGYEGGNCPKNSVYVANHDVGGSNKSGPGEFVQLTGLCCELPADDILTDRHTYSEFERCPDQYVATGGAGACEQGCTMRCTQINTKKYTLGPETVAYYVKDAEAGKLYGQGDTIRVHWQQLPESVRWGVLRSSHNEWTGDSCIGVPLGSMLVRKSSKRCDGFFYRELRYLDGVPVKIFPDCDTISDLYSPNPTCIKNSP